MVLPSAAGGAQVIRKGDGTAWVLLPDGSVGWYGGDSRGWEWTNAKGMRQANIRKRTLYSDFIQEPSEGTDF